MDIKDSYLHGTVGVVKSISVSADKLTYKLADINNTAKTITLPLATTTANGLMSKDDKIAINSLGNYVTLNTDQDITGTKTFTKQLKFTVAKGTAPFLVTSDTKVTNLNADLLDGVTNGDITAKYINTFTLNTEHTLDNILDGFYNYKDGINPSNVVGNNGAVIQISGRQWDRFLLLFPGNNDKGIRYRNSTHESSTTWVWTSWKTIAFTDSDITGNAATATHASTADKLKTKRKLWGLDFDGSADVSGNMTGVGIVNSIFEVNKGSGNAKLNVTSISSDRDYLSLYVSSNTSTNTTTRPLVVQHGYGNVGIGVIAPSEKLEVNGNVKATSFIGNLDGTYVNKLTNYKIANAIGSIAAVDSLNTALGKLEFKTDFIYNDLFGTDNDDVINKWHEIVDFIDSVKEGTDITDEFVTRKTDLEITGVKTFSKSINLANTRVSWIGGKSNASIKYNSYTAIDDAAYHPILGAKMNSGNVVNIGAYVNLFGFYGYKSDRTENNTDWSFVFDSNNGAVSHNSSITSKKFITKDGTSSQFVKGDGSLDSNTYLTSSGTIDYAKKLKYSTQIKTLEDLDGFLEASTFKVAPFSSITGPGFAGNDGMVLSIPWASTSYGAQIIIDDNHGGVVKIRQKENTTWSNWYTFLTSKNYTSYLPFLNSSDTHATNTSIIYTPTTVGTSGLILTSNGSGAPVWVDPSTIAVGKTKVLDNLYTNATRPTSLNIKFGDGGLRTFKATDSTTEGKCSSAAHILHLAWDATNGYNYQLALINADGSGYGLEFRGQNGNVWTEWHKVITDLNYDKYLGYIGTTAVQKESKDQALTGITRISNKTNANLYLGNSDNSGWVLTLDICSHSGYAKWCIKISGAATFKALTATTGTFSGQITSTVAEGTAPFIITSKTLNTNLNADLLDGINATGFLRRFSSWLETDNTKDANNLLGGATFAYKGHSNTVTTGVIVSFNSENWNSYTLLLLGDYLNNLFYFRNLNGDNNTWGTWNKIIHSNNYTDYINSTNFPGLAGVRSVTINNDYLRVNTNGTNTDLTIPYATKATSLKHTSLTTGLDLNTLTTEGVYSHTQTAVCNSLVNGPTGRSNGECRLEVINCGHSQHTLQLLYTKRGKSGEIWYRMGTSDAAWSTWKKIAFASDYLPLSGGTMTGNILLGGGNAILGSGNSIPAKFKDSAAINPEVHSVWLAATGTGSNNSAGGEASGILLDGNTIKMWTPMDNAPQIIDSDNGAAYTLLHSGNITKDHVGLGNVDNTADADKSVKYATSAGSASKLGSTTIVSGKAFSLVNTQWIDVKDASDNVYTFTNLASGTYAVQITCGNLVASGIMSVYKNIDDTAGDEIPLHVYHDSSQPWRPYLRTSGKKLLISSNDGSATSRTITIKIALIL